MNYLNYTLHGLWLIIISFLTYKSLYTPSGNGDQKDILYTFKEAQIGEKKYCYVNVDTLDANFKMVADLRKEIESQKKAYELKFQGNIKKFQEDYGKFQEEAKYLTQEQGLAKQNELLQREKSLAAMDEKMSNELMELEAKNQKKLQEAIKIALDSLNSNNQFDLIFGYNGMGNLLYANDHVDVTDDVLNILNGLYQQKSSK